MTSGSPPDDFTYRWESAGTQYPPFFQCAFCPASKDHKHVWRAYSEKYGFVYVCPRHLHHIGTGLRGERHMVWLALRAKTMGHPGYKDEAWK